MGLKILPDLEELEMRNVNPLDCFMYDGHVHMKTVETDKNFQGALNLGTGELVWVNEAEYVGVFYEATLTLEAKEPTP